ncbi:MAG: DUF1926 domain-containing protein [Candidatus Omnitrophica bacterium]|nr:DUF1926 domain-containing protein [Candidatus Omnitrophota bacterium]
MKNAKFAMAFHCYQPVFNFDREIERAYENAYLPLLTSIEKFPSIKTTFHFSGNLLEWLETRHPEYIELLKKLIWNNQLELMGGGCFEPVMTLIPERDRQGQLEMNKNIIGRMFGIETKGAWIGERVWEPSIADTLAENGIKYTIVDDNHILRAGKKEENIFKPCRASGERETVILFPSLTALRYSIPFRSPESTLQFMRNTLQKSGDDSCCFFYADDGEKFGLWPYTYQWVYKRGWLHNFLNALVENADWLKTMTYSEVMESTPFSDVGRVPESSYAEMMTWSGGHFKNFLKKYPEANRMHKRMVLVSDKIAETRDEIVNEKSTAKLSDARKELFKAQSGCAYWHGTFGGLYLPHLRAGVYRHLINAENIIGRGSNDPLLRVKITKRSEDKGKEEIVVENKVLSLFLKPDNGAHIAELDYKPLSVNLINSFSGIKEGYHRKLDKDYFLRIKQARQAAIAGKLVDVHDLLGVRERGLKKILNYDNYHRVSFLTHIFQQEIPWRKLLRPKVSCSNFLKGAYTSKIDADKDFVTCVFNKRDKVFADQGRSLEVEVEKMIGIGSGPAVTLSHKVIKHSAKEASLRYGLEFNFLLWDKKVMLRPRMLVTDKFSLKDQYSGLAVDFFLDKKCTVLMCPLYTVNETESGLNRTFQGISVLVGDDCTAQDDVSNIMMTLSMA